MPKLTTKILPPLRYPGSKSRANKFLQHTYRKVSESCKEYREAFIGGGSIALFHSTDVWNLRGDPATVWINDLYVPVYSFWWSLQNRCDEMVAAIREVRKEQDSNKMKEPFMAALKVVQQFEGAGSVKSDDDKLLAGINYYVVNRCCRSGMTSIWSEWASRPNNGGTFTDKKIGELKSLSNIIRNWKITNEDYSVLVKTPYDGNPKDVVLVMDPPYMLETASNLYGTKGEMHRGFPHEQFCDDMMACDFNWLITYGAKDANGDKKLMDWFAPHNPVLWPLRYSMQQSGKSGEKKTKVGREILISNFGYGPVPKFVDEPNVMDELTSAVDDEPAA
jgi:DNA adenine methylase